MKLIDLKGKRFGRLLVTSMSPKRVNGHAAWRCTCDCGARTVVPSNNLCHGNTHSCGCLQKELVAGRLLVHGEARRGGGKTVEWNAWQAAQNRCHNQNNPAFRYYGGRGIVVCSRWRNSYPAFLADMGRRPSAKHSLDRIDGRGNYEPGNCRWATAKEQRMNQTRLHLVTFRGDTLCLSAWAERVGINRSTLWNRLKRLNWSVARALTEAA